MTLIPLLAPVRPAVAAGTVAAEIAVKAAFLYNFAKFADWPALAAGTPKDFAQATGIMELFLEAGRMRFAINLDTAEGSGLHLSSRLLGLATIIRSSHGP